MDIPLKKLTRLLAGEQPAEVRAAAVVVLAEVGGKDAEVAAGVIAALDDADEAVRLAAIAAAGKLKLAKALPLLLARIKPGGEEAKQAADAAAHLGAAGVKGLQALMPQVAPGLRRYIAAALTGAGSGGAEAGVAVLLDPDPQVAAAAATAIVGRIPSLPAERKTDLAAGLGAIVGNKKQRLPAAAELAIVKVLLALNDPSAADVLWDWVLPPHVADVRAATLQALGGWITAPSKDQWKRLFACAADAEFKVAAPALMILGKLPVADKQLPEWVELFHAADVAARRLALEKLGGKDHAAVAAGLMAQLNHPDRALREGAAAKLAAGEHGRKAMASAVLAAATSDEAWALAKAVAPSAKTLSAPLRTELFAKAGQYLEDHDHRADAILFLLREADAHALRDNLVERAVAKRKKKDYATALTYLKLLGRDPATGFPVRLEQALCGLKESVKELAADSRANDACLRQFEPLIAADAAAALAEVTKAKWLEPEDLFYLGFHFAERFGAEKSFGAEVLKHVVKQSPKTKVAAAAKNKLKTVVV